MQNPTRTSCPKCGATIAADAPQGLCPSCVLGAVATDPIATRSSNSKTLPPTVQEVAAHFPELEILELIGAGGMGAVYKARQPKLDRYVALKILSAELTENPAFAERFNREGRVLARLGHPHIVTVFDFGAKGPFLYLLMEYVDGVNLREAMREGGFTPADCLSLVQDICAALKFAHEQGVLHRDIKPENVLIDSRGCVKIADFGLAKQIDSDGRDSVTLTRQGAVMGTLHYMAPEQFEAPQDVDQRADIYSLGVVFYELLTGELPLGRFAPPSDKTAMDPRVDEVVMRTLERKREQRYQTIGEVKTEVEAITQSPAWNPSQSPQAAATVPPTKMAPETIPKSSRLAFASAILTGLSLLLAVTVVFALMAISSVEPLPNQVRFQFMQVGLLGVVGFLFASLPAFLGFLFGIKALGDIRRSQGQLTGVVFALFGTLAWPIVLPVVCTGVGLYLLMPMGPAYKDTPAFDSPPMEMSTTDISSGMEDDSISEVGPVRSEGVGESDIATTKDGFGVSDDGVEADGTGTADGLGEEDGARGSK